ncbi:MAG: cell division protein FtsA [Acidobacteriaceae bacterium]|nr:cell division protein FtsA [Acidobacteriaceae bacterium]MBV9779550.1 cell division protein FtsA [Acidobacteriaceae bacterium]
MANKTKLAVGLDLGSTSTRIVICAVEEDAIRFLGHGEAPARAWNRSRLADQEALAASIRIALAEAEHRAKVSPEAALIGVGGSIAGVNSRGLYEFGRRREIESDDLRYAVQLAARVRLEDDREVLQICPQDFTIDGRAGYRNPKGISCARLEANVHIVTTSAHEHQGLISAVHQAHLAVEESIFEGMAAAYAAVLPADRARGVAVIDVGAQSTQLAIYEGEALLLATAIPIGADHFTRDISWLLKVNYEDAENLKREYGCARAGQVSEHSLVDVPSPEGRAPREVARQELNEILEARAEEILEQIYSEILRVGMEQSLLEGAILTGGGALLPGMCDVAERVLNCQARNGLATGIEDWPSELDSPTWTTAAGLAMYSGRLKLKRDWKRAAAGMAGMVAK